MAVRHPVSVVLIVFSALAVVFVVAGMCTPGWLILTITRTTPVYEERLSEQKTTINIGFNPYYAWAEECVSTGRNGQMSSPQCAEQTVDYSKIGEEGQYTADEDAFLWPSRVFGGIGLTLAIISCVLTIVWSTRSFENNPQGVFSLIGWYLGGCSLCLGIGIFSKQIAPLYYLETHMLKFPYSILLCGIAAFFCFLNGFIVTVWICKRRREAIPGAYNQFTNPPMVDPMGNSYGYAMGPSQGGYVIATSAVAPNNGYVIATNAPQQFCVVQPQGIPVTGK